VIINPNNGPGTGPQPQQEYATQMQKLATFSNVKRFGYVRTTYGTRNISDIISDISTYAGWSATGLGVHGIFFDEAPSEYTPGMDDYVKRINQVAKTAPGVLADRLVGNPASCATKKRLTLAM
jgi:hypothetical protein